MWNTGCLTGFCLLFVPADVEDHCSSPSLLLAAWQQQGVPKRTHGGNPLCTHQLACPAQYRALARPLPLPASCSCARALAWMMKTARLQSSSTCGEPEREKIESFGWLCFGGSRGACCNVSDGRQCAAPAAAWVL